MIGVNNPDVPFFGSRKVSTSYKIEKGSYLVAKIVQFLIVS